MSSVKKYLAEFPTGVSTRILGVINMSNNENIIANTKIKDSKITVTVSTELSDKIFNNSSKYGIILQRIVNYTGE